jgi:aldose 1-epimerase
MALPGPRFDIAAGHYRAAVSEIGAGLAGLWAGDRPVTRPNPADALPLMSSGAVLVPWPNRIRDGRYTFDGVEHQLPLSEPAKHNASHGLARWVRWTVLEHRPDQIALGVDLAAQTGYEYELRLKLTYTVAAEVGLSVRTEAVNIGSVAAPFGVGFHPYLDLDGHDVDHAEIELPAEQLLPTDEQQIPVGRQSVAGTPYDLRHRRPLGTLRLDHCFTGLGGDRARIGVGDWASELWWDEAFPYLQVFTAPARFGRTAIAVEPMSCPANAFNSGDGLIRLEPGQTWTGTWGISSTAA